jgi:hypothetical protein
MELNYYFKSAFLNEVDAVEVGDSGVGGDGGKLSDTSTPPLVADSSPPAAELLSSNERRAATSELATAGAASSNERESGII